MSMIVHRRRIGREVNIKIKFSTKSENYRSREGLHKVWTSNDYS